MNSDEFIQVMDDMRILAMQTDLTHVATLTTAPEQCPSPLKVDGWLKTGQHIPYALGTAIANLWLTMAQLIGIPANRIGDCNSPLRDIAAS